MKAKSLSKIQKIFSLVDNIHHRLKFFGSLMDIHGMANFVQLINSQFFRIFFVMRTASAASNGVAGCPRMISLDYLGGGV